MAQVDEKWVIREKAAHFEDLWIWQQARALVTHVYRDFGLGTPGGKDFGFRDQIQKAAISTMNNIAEGFERKSDADFARFLDMAKGSCGEVRSMYYPAEDLAYSDSNLATERREKLKQLAAGISSLTAHLRPS